MTRLSVIFATVAVAASALAAPLLGTQGNGGVRGEVVTLEERVSALEEEAVRLDRFVRESARGQDVVINWLDQSTWIRDRQLARCVRLLAAGRDQAAHACARNAVAE